MWAAVLPPVHEPLSPAAHRSKLVARCSCRWSIICYGPTQGSRSVLPTSTSAFVNPQLIWGIDSQQVCDGQCASAEQPDQWFNECPGSKYMSAIRSDYVEMIKQPSPTHPLLQHHVRQINHARTHCAVGCIPATLEYGHP